MLFVLYLYNIAYIAYSTFSNWSSVVLFLFLTHMHKQCESMEWRKHSAWQPGGRPAVYRIFSTNHLSYTKTLVPIYIFRAITFLGWCRYFYYYYFFFYRINGLFAPKIKKTCSRVVFQEALIVAPPCLDMCLDIYGAWINQKQSFDWDIILENIAFFGKNRFLKQKLFFVMDQTFTIKHFP